MKEFDEIEQLINFKKKSGWSYQKLANEIGVHYQTVIAWFTKGAKPSPLAKKAIRRFLINNL